jgi:hypothetical protein
MGTKRISLSEHAINALLFAYKYSDSFHYFNQDAKTLRAINRLAHFGLVSVDRIYNTFMITVKGMRYINEHEHMY